MIIVDYSGKRPLIHAIDELAMEKTDNEKESME